ncbi:hypothetical protein G7046_g5645 [Stylonectria norvegica]|nr:hypothetical protein G7046_g5645 [Stylonectria norvegica]
MEPTNPVAYEPTITNPWSMDNEADVLGAGPAVRIERPYLAVEHDIPRRLQERMSHYEPTDIRPPALMKSDEIDTSRNYELYRLHSIRFELDKGDTLVFVDYPTPTKTSVAHADCNGISFASQEFRVHSEKLLATKSSKFAEMLNPTYQFRVLRRRKLVNKLPEGIKYVLDLTPPSEGDELVFQMTELSLTPGVTKWWQSSLVHGVDAWLVTGHDDTCKCYRLAMDVSTKENAEPQSPTSDHGSEHQESPPPPKHKVAEIPLKIDTILRMKANGENDNIETPPFRRLPDYCPVRHRNGIVRLLMLIEGRQVMLDSANRVWTLVKLCSIFDCTSVLRDRVVQWIMHGRNTRFIEVLPEESLQIGFILELPEVTQCAFRILVSEFALEEAAEDDTRQQYLQTTIFGRKKHDIPDELRNLVQHSARALVERVSQYPSRLSQPGSLESWNIPQRNRLRAIEHLLSQNDSEVFVEALRRTQTLITALDGAVTDNFANMFVKQSANNETKYISVDNDRVTYVEPADFEITFLIVRRLNIVQRFLMPFIYADVAADCTTQLFYEKKIKDVITPMHKYMGLREDAEKAIQQVINSNPQLGILPEWSPCFSERFSSKDAIRQVQSPLVWLHVLDQEIKEDIRHKVLHVERRDSDLPLNLTRHLLLTLTNNELKYLPLWAGGCDDGTGGVFESFLPPAEMGPNGPGPAYHTGLTLPSSPSSTTGTLTDGIEAMRVIGSTTAGSVDVHDSISTVYRPDRVIVDDVSMESESFTEGSDVYQDAMYEHPAAHQSMGEAIATVVEAMDEDTQPTTTDHETMNELNDSADDDMSFWNDESDNDSDDSFVTV